MIVSIHQPAYIPWMGYFDKIAKSDIHIFLDDVEYSKNNFFNRNKIKTPIGWMWLTIPVNYKNGQKICETKISNSFDWKRKHLTAIQANYSNAKYFSKYSCELKECYNIEAMYLSDFTINMNMIIADLLDINVKFVKASDLNAQGSKNERLINLCKSVAGDTYLSGQGAKEYMDDQLFLNNGINVIYQDFTPPRYEQLWDDFIPNMSIMDYIFNCGVEYFQNKEFMRENEK